LPLPGLRVGVEEVVDVEVVVRELVIVPDVEDDEEVADEPDTLEELVEMAGLREEVKDVAEE
jgi:AMMECR1 domain-containing protein